MPSSFANQFALSLEITRLLPISTITETTALAVYNLARGLRNSGSDIIVEQDLAEAFGRCRITHEIERSFRTIVGKSSGTTSFSGEILLQRGPGPTVTRALVSGQAPYLNCLVQCSFLSWVHNKHSLAGAIVQALEKRVHDASPDADVKAPPSQDSVLGYLTACEEQTNAFIWDHYLHGFASIFGWSQRLARDPLPAVILRGALDMFPLVQQFPENYLVHVITGPGLCILLVWAHRILGLNVLLLGEGHQQGFRLGNGEPQVVVDHGVEATRSREASITLLDSSEEPHEVLITIKSDADESVIDGTWKITARGYGRTVLETFCDRESDLYLTAEASSAIVEEMAPVTGANAMAIGKNLIRKRQVGTLVKIPTIRCAVERRAILKATRFLFDCPRLEEQELLAYQAPKPFSYNSLPPSSVAGALEVARDRKHGHSGQKWAESFWEKITKSIQRLSLVVLAFAHVRNLVECDGLPLCGSLELLNTLEHILDKLRFNMSPENTIEIDISDNTWFNAIALLLVGHVRDIDLSGTCLLSDRGWSIYMNTFRVPDPAYVDSDFFRIQMGVPVRNGVRKHAIIDGPATGLDSSRWESQTTCGDSISLSCFDDVKFGNNQYGERQDNFLVNLRLIMPGPASSVGTITRRTGLRELNAASWMTELTQSCDHQVVGREEVILPRGCAAVRGFGELGNGAGKPLPSERILICLTANNVAARWRALIAIKSETEITKKPPHGICTGVLLRKIDCCLKCAITQTVTRPGNYILVL